MGLICVCFFRIVGAERFDVVWLHNNKEIKPSKDFMYSSEANIHKLTIAEIFPEDSGKHFFKLNILLREQFIVSIPFYGMITKFSDMFSFYFFSFTFSYSVIYIMINMKIRFLLDFCMTFKGVYTCEAFNDCGESFSSCSLVVAVPGEEMRSPFFKQFPASATVATGEGASFTAETDSVS